MDNELIPRGGVSMNVGRSTGPRLSTEGTPEMVKVMNLLMGAVSCAHTEFGELVDRLKPVLNDGENFSADESAKEATYGFSTPISRQIHVSVMDVEGLIRNIREIKRRLEV